MLSAKLTITSINLILNLLGTKITYREYNTTVHMNMIAGSNRIREDEDGARAVELL